MRGGWQMLGDGIFVRPADGRVLVRTRWKPMIWQTAAVTAGAGAYRQWVAVCMGEGVSAADAQAVVDEQHPAEAGAVSAWLDIESARLEAQIAKARAWFDDLDTGARMARAALDGLMAERAAIEAKRGAK